MNRNENDHSIPLASEWVEQLRTEVGLPSGMEERVIRDWRGNSKRPALRRFPSAAPWIVAAVAATVAFVLGFGLGSSRVAREEFTANQPTTAAAASPRLVLWY